MDRLIEEVRGALRANAFTLALQGALALVDICGSLAAENGRSTRTTFKACFADNLGEAYDLLDASDVYLLRCGMLHQGRMASDQYEFILFTLPNSRGIRFVQDVMNTGLILDLEIFCTSITDAAERWWSVHQFHEPVFTNAASLARVRPTGFDPIIVGLPVYG